MASNDAQIFYVKAEKQLERHRAFHSKLKVKMDDRFSKAFAGELKILETRIKTMELVVENQDADKLKQHIAMFKETIHDAQIDESAPGQRVSDLHSSHRIGPAL